MPSRYFDPWQWRLYLLATGAARLRYEIFQIKRVRNYSEMAYDVVSFADITMSRYPGMRAECEAIVREFAEVAEQIGWKGR